jgi:hypothetical protein
MEVLLEHVVALMTPSSDAVIWYHNPGVPNSPQVSVSYWSERSKVDPNESMEVDTTLVVHSILSGGGTPQTTILKCPSA